MSTLTLLARVNHKSQLRKVDWALKDVFEDLKVDIKILGLSADRWVRIGISGEDETIATNYLIREVGVCPESLDNVKESSVLKGYITDFDEKRKWLWVDVGIFKRKIAYATLSLDHLQAQLLDGKEVSMNKISELFGFCDGVPLTVRVISINNDEENIEAKIAPTQIDRFMSWRRSLLDRLLVLGSSLKEVEKAVAHTHLDRDILEIEFLGVLDHSLVCKFGTEARGLIPKIGKLLRYSKFEVFSPERILRFLYSI